MSLPYEATNVFLWNVAFSLKHLNIFAVHETNNLTAQGSKQSLKKIVFLLNKKTKLHLWWGNQGYFDRLQRPPPVAWKWCWRKTIPCHFCSKSNFSRQSSTYVEDPDLPNQSTNQHQWYLSWQLVTQNSINSYMRMAKLISKMLILKRRQLNFYKAGEELMICFREKNQ